MWFPPAIPGDPPDRRVALWLHVLEVLLTAILVAVAVWNLLSGTV